MDVNPQSSFNSVWSSHGLIYSGNIRMQVYVLPVLLTRNTVVGLKWMVLVCVKQRNKHLSSARWCSAPIKIDWAYHWCGAYAHFFYWNTQIMRRITFLTGVIQQRSIWKTGATALPTISVRIQFVHCSRPKELTPWSERFQSIKNRIWIIVKGAVALNN